MRPASPRRRTRKHTQNTPDRRPHAPTAPTLLHPSGHAAGDILLQANIFADQPIASNIGTKACHGGIFRAHTDILNSFWCDGNFGTLVTFISAVILLGITTYAFLQKREARKKKQAHEELPHELPRPASQVD